MAVSIHGIDNFGTFNPKRLDHIIEDLKIYLKMFHGPDLLLNPGDPDLELVHAIAPEFRTVWTAMQMSYLQSFLTTAEGDALDQFCALLQIYRRLALKATGEVTFSRDTPAPLGGITIPIGTIVATVSGIRFVTSEAVTIDEGDSSVTAAIEASEAGDDSNVGANTIQSLISTVAGIDSVNNAAAVTNGRDRESDTELRARALGSPSLRGTSTPDAIQARLAAVSIQAYVAVNRTRNSTADKVILAAGAGTVNGTEANAAQSEGVARRFTVAAPGAWIQDLVIRVDHGATAPTITAAIVTDNAGLPTATLADANLQLAGLTPGDDAEAPVHFPAPVFLEPGDYHARLIPTVGDFRLKGIAGAGAGDVSWFNGTVWAADTTINTGSIGILSGIGPNGIEAFVDGGDEDVIAATLLKALGAGTTTTGDIEKEPLDRSGNPQTVYFSRPDSQIIYAQVEITVDD